MALVLADRVQEYSTTTGTGTLTLSGAYAGFQTFAAGIGNGNTCYYTITSDTNQWEVGIGTVGVGTLARTTLISSSTGSLVSFVGTLTVFVTYPAEKAVYSDGTTIVAPTGALLPVTSGGTGASTAAAARTALGLGTIATQAANSVAITGGAIDGTTVGATTVAAGSFSTLNSSGATRLGGLSGNQSLQVNNVASAVNYIQTIGSVTNQTPTLSVQGTDAGIGFLISTKGIGGFGMYTGGGAQLAISHTASAVNYLQLTGAATGAAPTISAQGSDTNIDLVVTGKGTGVVALGGSTAANSAAQFVPTTSSVNFLQFTGGSNPVIAIGGTDANVPLTIRSKGTFNVTFQTSGGAALADFAPSTTGFGVNLVRLTGAGTGNPPSVSAIGSDTDINLRLIPKGTGTVQFGTYTAGILAQAGYITITDAGGTSRRLLVG